MIKYLKHKEIDLIKWDKCINNAYNELIYSNSWYLDYVSPNWEALVFGEYEAVMPLTWKKKYGIKYLYPPFFTQQLGVFSKNQLTAKQIQLFLEAIPAKFKFMDLFLNSKNMLDDSLYSFNRKPNYFLSLNATFDELSNKYNSNCKRNISKATKNGLKIKQASASEIIDFYRINYAHIESNSKSEDYLKFEALVNILKEKGNAETIGVFQEEIMCGGGIFIKDSNRIYYLLGASNSIGKKYGAVHFFMNWIIKKYAGSNLILDFEGSEIESIADFFKQFGSEKEEYIYLKINKLPPLLKFFKK